MAAEYWRELMKSSHAAGDVAGTRKDGGALKCLCLPRSVLFSSVRLPALFLFLCHSGNMGKTKNHLPDRWTDYTPLGKRIPGTRFIAFKVPLKKIFNSKIESWQRFSSADLIRDVQAQKEELGLIIDLTCTTRYYSPEELPESLHYAKIFTVGHEVPSDETIFQFKCIINRFLKENSNNDKLIGVHCTHGLNRTGYLVCRYLIDVLGMVPSDAIEKFNQSRGHCIERKNYLDDLMCGEMRRNAETDKPLLPLPKYHQKIPNVNNPSVPPCLTPPHRPEQPWFSRFGNPMDAPRIPEPRPIYSHPPRHNMPRPMYNDPAMDYNCHMYPREADWQQFQQWKPHPYHYGYQPPSRNPNGFQPSSRNTNNNQPPSRYPDTPQDSTPWQSASNDPYIRHSATGTNYQKN
ncbi:dual specificity phosphatase 11 L homeolog isoform X2 [Xenopus laevis]|uniref:RNA/RNP complex-1-interacting phosphatase n=1 Tax=Xenopus laevis TaxID=8355 RepID=A0A8J1MGC3_XENLA|nr:dual specificity phosphatase 11 L homeolog isoform X2 [Xenopus laevis]